MKVNDIIQQFDVNTLILQLQAKMTDPKYPGLSQREVIKSFNVPNLTPEQANKIVDQLDSHVTSSLMSFKPKI